MQSNIKKTEHGFGHIEVVLIVVIVGILGFTIWRVATVEDVKKSASNDTVQQETQSEELTTALDGIKPVEEIQTIATEANADTTVVGIELESEDGKTVYVVYLSNGKKLTYDATTGELLETSTHTEDDSNSIPANFTATITIQQAIEKAKQEHPGSAVKKVEIDTEDGVVVYSVRFVDDARVDISAADGTVVRTKTESDDSNDDTSSSSGDSNDDDQSDDSDDDSSSSHHSSGGTSGSSGSGSSNDDGDDDSSSSNSGSSSNDDEEDDSDDDNSGSNSGQGSDDEEDDN